VLQHQQKQMLKPLPLKATRKTHQRLTQKPPLPLSNLEDNDDFVIDDEVVFGRNLKAREFGKVVTDDLSDYVKFRLWLARQLALRKYEKVWG
jgi:hypothetical protein